MVKKINAFISLLCCLSLLGHFGTMSYSMLTGWYNFVICKRLAHTTALTVSIHVFLVLIIFFFLHDGSNFSRYWRENIRTIIQRSSGIVIILLVHAHVKNYGFIISGEPFMMVERIRICVMEVIFFTSIFAHVATSFVKAFITLGLISDDKKINTFEKIVNIVCVIGLLLIVVNMLRFVITFGV